MKKPSTPKRPSPRPIILATGGAVLLILVGSFVAFNQAGLTPAALAGFVSESFSRLIGADLIVSVDQSILPADGKTSTFIYATNTNPDLPITAELVSGSGTLKTSDTKAGKTTFTYTTGKSIGEVSIIITSGSLTQNISLTLQEAIVPATPTLSSPTDKTTTSNPYPEVSGTGPANTKILITDNGNVNSVTRTDGQGNFRITIEKALYGGKHTLAAIAQSELGVVSIVSNLATITVEAEPIKLDFSHIRTSPTRIIAGDSFGLFVPASLNTSRMTAELQGKTYELQNLHKTSIFTATLPAPEQAGTGTINLVGYDLAGSPTKFDKALSILIVSS